MSDRRSMYGPRIHTALRVIPGGLVNRNLSQPSPIVQPLPAEPKRRSRVLSALIPSFTFRNNSKQPPTESQGSPPIESQLEHRQQQSFVPSPHLPQSLPSSLSFQQHHSSYPHRTQFKCSASTLSRAAKAKQYLELFIEYIDLLDTLPLAKEIPNLPHNHPQQQQPYHQHCHPPIHHSSPSQLLSRNYNPLQTIRNRRLRNRQGFGQLDLTPWEDPISVRSWVKSTITASQDATFHDSSEVNSSLIYPPFLQLPPPPHHHPMDKHKNKPKRSKLDWVVHPSELFADFYWMNEGCGMTIVEDRFGEKIFKRGSTPTTGSNASAASSVGVRGSLDKARGSGRGVPLNQARKPDTLGKWTSSYGDYNRFSIGIKAREGSDTLVMDAGAAKTIHGNDVAERMKAPDQLGCLSLPVGPGITVGIGGGYISPDESVDEEESEGDEYGERRGRTSLESRRYSSQLEDEFVQRDTPIPLRRMFFEGPERMRTDKHVPKKRHHNFYRFVHQKASHEDEGQLSDSSLESAASSDSEASSKKKDNKCVTRKRGHHKWSGLNASADLNGSYEDLAAEGEIFGTLEKHLKPTAFIRRLKQKTRRHPTSKNETIDDSDEDTNYESATAMSRSPSPAIIPHQDPPPRSSVDKGKGAVEFPLKNNTIPPPIRDMECMDTPGHKASSSAGTPSVDGLKERGRERNGVRDDGLGTFFKRTISPMKRESLVQKSSKYSGEERTSAEKHIASRDSKDFERDALALFDKDRDKDKKNRAINTVKKAKEKVGNRVERIKHGVGGFMRGKEVSPSAPSSNYASSLGSGGGISDREEYSEDGKPKKSWVSRDLERISRSQKRRPKHRHVKQSSGVNLLHIDLDTGTATPSDASVDGDGEDFWQRRGIHNMVEDSTKMETLKAKATGPLREQWPLIRNVGSFEEFRSGGIKPKREKSRLAEEIRDDIDHHAVGLLTNLAPLGRLRLPPIATIPRSSLASGVPTKQSYHGKRDLARARALTLSTGMLARGMASRAQTLQQKFSAAAPPEFIGTLQLTARHHAISARHLSLQIHSANQDLENRILKFRNVTISHLRNQILCTQDEISEKLTPLVQKTADEADVLSGELSTHYVFEVKRLHDEVSMLVRKRRRTTLKWVRRGGYVLLEWVVLAVMWWVWLIVVMVRIARVILSGAARGLKWMILWE